VHHRALTLEKLIITLRKVSLNARGWTYEESPDLYQGRPTKTKRRKRLHRGGLVITLPGDFSFLKGKKKASSSKEKGVGDG